MNQSAYSYKIVHSITNELILKWRHLWKNSEQKNPFNSYEWYQSVLATYPKKKPQLHVLYRDQNLVGIIALQVEKKFGVSTYCSLDTRSAVDTPFLVESFDPEVIRTFLEYICSGRNVFLYKVNTGVVNYFPKKKGHVLTSLISVNPYVLLQNDAVFATVSKKTLHKLKNINKRFKNELHTKIYTGKEVLDQLPTVFSIDKHSAKSLSHKDIFAAEDMKKLFTAISTFESDIVQLRILIFNDTPILFEFGMLYKNVFLGYVTSYLYEYRKLNPGKLMVYNLIEELRDKGVQMLDMGGGISDYKSEFTKNYHLLYNVYSSPNVFTVLWWRSLNFSRRIKQILFPIKHTKDHEFLFKTSVFEPTS